MTENEDPRAEAYAEVDYRRRFSKPTEPSKELHDVYLILKYDEAWQGVIAEDQFAQRIVKLKPPPYVVGQGEAGAGEWSEIDDSRAAVWLAEKFGLTKVATGTVAEAVHMVANDNAFHPVRDYLDALEWDGEPRVEWWLGEYLNARYSLDGQGPEDSKRYGEYMRMISRLWLISAVARIYEPGCKADYVLILEGRQRIGKSTALGILGGPWFSDTPIAIGDKDAYQGLAGKWIIELPELDAFNKAEAAKLKAFFSSRVDNYRPPYGRRNRDFPRQCVFAGTTNQAEYLRDSSGNLRYFPAVCYRLEAELLRRDVDQLWAEATHRYKAGEQWWPQDEEFELLAWQQSAREIMDPWEDIIGAWLEERQSQISESNPVTVNKILRDVLEIEPKKQDERYQASRVGKILKKLGYRKRQFGSREQRTEHGRYWYEPPASPEREPGEDDDA